MIFWNCFRDNLIGFEKFRGWYRPFHRLEGYVFHAGGDIDPIAAAKRPKLRYLFGPSSKRVQRWTQVGPILFHVRRSPPSPRLVGFSFLRLKSQQPRSLPVPLPPTRPRRPWRLQSGASRFRRPAPAPARPRGALTLPHGDAAFAADDASTECARRRRVLRGRRSPWRW